MASRGGRGCPSFCMAKRFSNGYTPHLRLPLVMHYFHTTHSVILLGRFQILIININIIRQTDIHCYNINHNKRVIVQVIKSKYTSILSFA